MRLNAHQPLAMASTLKCIQLLAIIEIVFWAMCFLIIVDPFEKTQACFLKMENSEFEKQLEKMAEKIPTSIYVLVYDVYFIICTIMMQEQLSLDTGMWKKESTGPFLFAVNAITSCVSTSFIE